MLSCTFRHRNRQRIHRSCSDYTSYSYHRYNLECAVEYLWCQSTVEKSQTISEFKCDCLNVLMGMPMCLHCAAMFKWPCPLSLTLFHFVIILPNHTYFSLLNIFNNTFNCLKCIMTYASLILILPSKSITLQYRILPLWKKFSCHKYTTNNNYYCQFVP